jgi:MFS family permease
MFQPLVTRNAFIGMLYMFGMLIGSYVFGVISDKWGRRTGRNLGNLVRLY